MPSGSMPRRGSCRWPGWGCVPTPGSHRSCSGVCSRVRSGRCGSILTSDRRSRSISCEARVMSDPIEVFQRDGYVIFERAIGRSAIEELVQALARYEADRPMGRNAFEGERSERVYSLAGKGEPFLRLAEQRDVLSMLDRVLLPNYLLSTAQSIQIGRASCGGRVWISV